MEDAVTVRLLHLRVNVEARVAELCNLFGQELNAVHRVTKDDRLVDVKLNAMKMQDKKRVLNEELSRAGISHQQHSFKKKYLRKKGVEAVHFLALLHEGVELGNTLESQIVHQVDLVRVRDEIVLKRLHCHGKGSRKEADLPCWRRQVNQLL